MKRIFFLLLCLCFSVLSFAQRTNETKQLTKQDSLRAEALAAGLIRHLRIFPTHMNVVLAAGIILIVGTVYNRTV